MMIYQFCQSIVFCQNTQSKVNKTKGSKRANTFLNSHQGSPQFNTPLKCPQITTHSTPMKMRIISMALLMLTLRDLNTSALRAPQLKIPISWLIQWKANLRTITIWAWISIKPMVNSILSPKKPLCPLDLRVTTMKMLGMGFKRRVWWSKIARKTQMRRWTTLKLNRLSTLMRSQGSETSV